MDATSVENNLKTEVKVEFASPTKTLTGSPKCRVSYEKSPSRKNKQADLKNATLTKGSNGEESEKGRIVYDREALIQLRSKACQVAEPNIPIELMKTRKGNSPSDFNSPDRKKAGGSPTLRKDNSQIPRDDSISLRPHSGNFSSGCTPNLSPNNGPFVSRFHSQEDQSKSFFDRDYSRNQFRNPPMRMDPQDRGRDRAREGRGREERPPRDFDGERGRDGRDRERPGRDQDRSFRGAGSRANPVENGRRSYGQGYHSWAPDEPSDWSRQKSNEPNNFRRDYNDRHRGMEQEPEWFSEGPITHNDTIELRGFHDDDRQDTGKGEKENRTKKDLNAKIAAGEKLLDLESEVHRAESPKAAERKISLEKILAMDQFSNILSNGLIEHEEPSGSSRFSQLFQRYSEAPSNQELNGVKRSSSLDNIMTSAPNDAKNDMEAGIDVREKAARDIEVALRNLLLNKPEEEQEGAKENIQAFKKLLDQIVVKGGSQTDKTDSPHTSQNVPKPSTEPLSPMSDAFARIARLDPKYQPKPRPEIQAFFSNFIARAMAMDGPPKPATTGLRFPPDLKPEPPRQIPPPSAEAMRQAQACLQQQRFPPPRNPVPGHPGQMKLQQHQRPSFSAFEVLNLLPLEMQSLVLGARIGPEFMKRPDVMQIINALNTGEVILGDIIQQLGALHNPHKPILAGVLKLGLNGVIPIPGLVYAPAGVPHMQPAKFQPHPNVYQPHPPHFHFHPHPHFPMHRAPPPMHIPNQGNPHNGPPHFNGAHHGY